MSAAIRTICTRLRGAAIGLAVAGSAVLSPIHAQTLPPTGSEDLTVPPDLRNGGTPQAAAPARKPVRPDSKQASHAQRAAKKDPAVTPGSMPRKDNPEHPVDVGVTMRGGSGTPRVYGPTGASEAIQESGSAFGAAMKFGF